MAKLSFNAAKAEPMEERQFTLIPEGEYILSIVKSEIVENSKKTAERLNMQAKILNGEHKGGILFIGLNWGHPNKVAQDISDREFKSICDAVGKGGDELEDTAEIHGIPFIGTVRHSEPSKEKKEDGVTPKYGPKAEIKKYESAEGHSLAEGVSSEPAEEGDSEKPAEKPPWG